MTTPYHTARAQWELIDSSTKKLSFCYLNTKWLQVAQSLLLVSSVQQQRPHTAPPETLGRTSGFDLGGRKVVGGCQDVVMEVYNYPKM